MEAFIGKLSSALAILLDYCKGASITFFTGSLYLWWCYCSSWSLEVTIRYISDGHLLSFETVEDYKLSLIIQNKQPILILGFGGDVLQQVAGTELAAQGLIDLVSMIAVEFI